MTVVIYLVGTSDTKAAEITYLRNLLVHPGVDVCTVDVGTRGAGCEMDVPPAVVAGHHPDGIDAVFGSGDRGTSVAAMARAFAGFCAAHSHEIAAIIGIGGGGGTSIISEGMRELPYGVPKLMVSTLASGDVAPYVDTSDIIMMPSVTDIAGLNRISRHIMHNAAQSILGMAANPYVAQGDIKPSVGLSMFGVTTPCVTQISALLEDQLDCVVFHATGTGGRSMERLLGEGMLGGLIDMTTTEIADEVVGGVLSAGAARLDAVMASGKPYVGSVGALDMVNFWAPDTVPDRFKDRLFYHHNANVTLMRTTAADCAAIGTWIADKLNTATGQVILLLPEKGISALDIADGPFWDPEAQAALFGALENGLRATDTRQVRRLPKHINDPAFSAAAAEAYLSIS
ncbi:Tm-1-like ATP-binding domain-containing protein [Sedimentitalea todarodis]|uniref:Tm-1-like ATP-binding domain-containing protein n=1 Tax=Sedimentitalea todarodis TaxID=1631240 RepID=A0ABU3VDF1_9RHOB|nr:Tm-1-like ATP-binding domain-containing protein [Sedimentitalea todarodis]MDU9004204.1 Tm-1-like ATP-binding domain-containing protein [Sedimentitalea todarodis]